MKEFLADFQVDTGENKALAGVCAGLGNYFNIQTSYHVPFGDSLVIPLFD